MNLATRETAGSRKKKKKKKKIAQLGEVAKPQRFEGADVSQDGVRGTLLLLEDSLVSFQPDSPPRSRDGPQGRGPCRAPRRGAEFPELPGAGAKRKSPFVGKQTMQDGFGVGARQE